MTVRILLGDVRTRLKELHDESAHCCVTSPPYFGLRDYGVNGQIGLEKTPDDYIAELVNVFREVRRVLRKDGTLWLNLGDSYASNAKTQSTPTARGGRFGSAGGDGRIERPNDSITVKRPDGWDAGAKAKDLLMVPCRVALALQADGWWLRSDIIWHKPNPMPESVTDRPTSAHEHIFLLAKSERYYFDAEAVKVPLSDSSIDRLSQNVEAQEGSRRANGGAKTNGAMKTVGERPQRARAIALAKEKGLTAEHLDAIRAAGVSDVGKAQVTQSGFGKNTDEVMRLAAEAKEALGGYYREFLTADSGRNIRNVWTVATQPFSEAHFATFPPALIEPCIKAGCPMTGTVLDPFGGAGTTGLVADRLGRNAILCELNPEYAAIAKRRLEGDGGMFSTVEVAA